MRLKPKLFIVASTVVGAAGALYLNYNKELILFPDLSGSFTKKDLPKPESNADSSDYKTYLNAIRESKRALGRFKCEMGIPGMVVGVSVNGKIVWNEGFGEANVETQSPCHAGTKMRIASISKPITMTLLAKLVENGLVDLDKPIQEYVPYFPKKTFNNKQVTITPRLVACHMAGIRHYHQPNNSMFDEGAEFYLKEYFKDVQQSVHLFLNDDLLSEPGTQFLYTTHGYTLLSGVIEGATNEPFTVKFKKYLKELDLNNTHLDEVETIVSDRASYYSRGEKGILKNAKLTDNSYKWAGGGLVSTTGDLLKFANIMLASAQNKDAEETTYLKMETVREIWSSYPGTVMKCARGAGYGLGWTVVPHHPGWLGGGDQKFRVCHSGGAVGASSILIIEPSTSKDQHAPKGVAVAIIANLQDISFYKLGSEILEHFRNES